MCWCGMIEWTHSWYKIKVTLTKNAWNNLGQLSSTLYPDSISPIIQLSRLTIKSRQFVFFLVIFFFWWSFTIKAYHDGFWIYTLFLQLLSPGKRWKEMSLLDEYRNSQAHSGTQQRNSAKQPLPMPAKPRSRWGFRWPWIESIVLCFFTKNNNLECRDVLKTVTVTCVCAQFDQFLPVRSHFDTKRPLKSNGDYPR